MQVFNYYRHHKARKCTMIKNKCSAINEEENIEPIEETEKNLCFDSSRNSCSASINNDEANSLAQNRNGSCASSIDGSTKKKTCNLEMNISHFLCILFFSLILWF